MIGLHMDGSVEIARKLDYGHHGMHTAKQMSTTAYTAVLHCAASASPVPSQPDPVVWLHERGVV